MIWKFLRERLSWIILFIVLQFLNLFITYIDPSMSTKPTLYTIFLSMVILIIFLFARYHKEVRYYKHLNNWQGNYDVSDLPKAVSPLEEIIETSLRSQTDYYRYDLGQKQIIMEQQSDDLTSWIHDVKTPLTAIKLIIDRVENTKTKQQLTYEWLRIHLLLDQQLHQSRIPTIENDLYIEQTRLEPLIKQEIKDVQSWCISKGIGIDVELDVKTVLTDGKWLSFIIRQLLTNAIKYSDHDNIVITSYQTKHQTILTIQDNGRGIAAKDLPRIFERGFTSTTSHHDTASSGMGLYLTKRIAKPLHINIDVDSIPQKGTIFSLNFPRKNDFIAITGM